MDFEFTQVNAKTNWAQTEVFGREQPLLNLLTAENQEFTI